MFKNVRTIFEIKKFKIDIYVICIDKGCVGMGNLKIRSKIESKYVVK